MFGKSPPRWKISYSTLYRLCVCVLSRSVVSDSLWPPWTVAHQAPLSMGILQARILERVAMPFCRGSSSQRLNPDLPHCRRILYPATTVKKAQPLVDLFGFWRHRKSYLEIELQPFYQVIGEIASFEWYPEQYGLPRWLRGKESACQCRKCGFDPWVRMTPWRRKWQPTLVFLPGKIPWTEETGSYSPWDTIYQLNTHASPEQ